MGSSLVPLKSSNFNMLVFQSVRSISRPFPPAATWVTTVIGRGRKNFRKVLIKIHVSRKTTSGKDCFPGKKQLNKIRATPTAH